jgi:hypothetical protein
MKLKTIAAMSLFACGNAYAAALGYLQPGGCMHTTGADGMPLLVGVYHYSGHNYRIPLQGEVSCPPTHDVTGYDPQ